MELIDIPEYFESELETEKDNSAQREPSLILSSTPVTVTSCAVDQLLDVKVNVLGETESSVESDAVTVTVTLFVGSDAKTTVKLSVLPDSTTAVLLFVSAIVIAAVSSSTLTAVTVLLSKAP